MGSSLQFIFFDSLGFPFFFQEVINFIKVFKSYSSTPFVLYLLVVSLIITSFNLSLNPCGFSLFYYWLNYPVVFCLLFSPKNSLWRYRFCHHLHISLYSRQCCCLSKWTHQTPDHGHCWKPCIRHLESLYFLHPCFLVFRSPLQLDHLRSSQIDHSSIGALNVAIFKKNPKQI